MLNQPLAPVASPVPLEKLAYDAIKTAILSFRFKPGENLVESTLAQQLSISKTPVREALSRLEKEEFIIKIPYKGYYVAEVTPQSVIDIFEIRAVLEGLALRLAATRCTPADIETVRVLINEHSRVASACNIKLASEYNRQFHSYLIKRSGNERLIHMLENIEDHLIRYRILSNFQSGRLKKSVSEHQQILQAIIDQNPIQAEKAAREHLMSVSSDLTLQDFNELVGKIKQQQ
jgi:DNA-binding GntR family transcriptional regulator